MMEMKALTVWLVGSFLLRETRLTPETKNFPSIPKTSSEKKMVLQADVLQFVLHFLALLVRDPPIGGLEQKMLKVLV